MLTRYSMWQEKVPSTRSFIGIGMAPKQSVAMGRTVFFSRLRGRKGSAFACRVSTPSRWRVIVFACRRRNMGLCGQGKGRIKRGCIPSIPRRWHAIVFGCQRGVSRILYSLHSQCHRTRLPTRNKPHPRSATSYTLHSQEVACHRIWSKPRRSRPR